MCYGNGDPKFMMRDIEARVRGLSFEAKEAADAPPAPGLKGWIAAMLDRLRQKEATHG